MLSVQTSRGATGTLASMLKKLTLTDVAARLSLLSSECMNCAMRFARERHG